MSEGAFGVLILAVGYMALLAGAFGFGVWLCEATWPKARRR